MTKAMHRGSNDLTRFTRGLLDDLSAITSGLTGDWSNREGQIHGLKLRYLQGYERAGCAL